MGNTTPAITFKSGPTKSGFLNIKKQNCRATALQSADWVSPRPLLGPSAPLAWQPLSKLSCSATFSVHLPPENLSSLRLNFLHATQVVLPLHYGPSPSVLCQVNKGILKAHFLIEKKHDEHKVPTGRNQARMNDTPGKKDKDFLFLFAHPRSNTTWCLHSGANSTFQFLNLALCMPACSIAVWGQVWNLYMGNMGKLACDRTRLQDS